MYSFVGSVAAVVLVFFAFQFSWSLIFSAVITFVIGYVFADYFLHIADGAPDFTRIFNSSKNIPRDVAGGQKEAKIVGPVDQPLCTVCYEKNCRRRNGATCVSTPNIYNISGPKISKLIDDAIHEFLELVLKNYVHNWYEELISTDDKTFPVLLRHHIRYAFGRLNLRLRRVDLTKVILDEVLPKAVDHASVYASVRRIPVVDETAEELEERVLARLQSSFALHPALTSRTAELAYLRRFSEFSINKLADKNLSTSSIIFLRELFTFAVFLPSADAIADPDVINRLLELFFDPTPMRIYDDENLSPDVVFLKRFVDESLTSLSFSDTVLLQVKLSEIIRDPSLLYVFMNYLKSVQAPLNWLQFILSAEDIQEQLRCGRTLSREDIAHIHWQSWELYRNYLHDGAPDKLDDDVLPGEISVQLKAAVEDTNAERAVSAVDHILERAYQIIYQQLQKRYVTPFCQSTHFLEGLCSSRTADDEIAEGCASETVRVKGDLLTVSDQPTLVASSSTASGFSETQNMSSNSGSDEEELILAATRSAALPDDIPTEMRDASQWKISVPCILPRREPQTGGTMYVYAVEVEAPGGKRWQIDRRYREFYILESKLVEFHGESVSGGFPLPGKKTFNNKSRAFVGSQRVIFEQFLKRLSANPALKGSEMLRAFLTSKTELTASFLPDPLKAMKKMPGKLARERGQNLAPFLQSLVQSVLKSGANPDCASAETTVLFSILGAEEKSVQEKIFATHYKNNCDMTVPAQSSSQNSDRMNVSEPSILVGVYDVIIYLAHKIFEIPKIPWIVLISARALVRQTFDAVVRNRLRNQLNTALHEQRVVEVIHALRDLIFYDDDGPRNDEQKMERKKSAFAMAKQYFDTELGFVKKAVGEECFDRGLGLLFDCLQCPLLNKQLLYVLLDIAVCEIFPEINKNLET